MSKRRTLQKAANRENKRFQAERATRQRTQQPQTQEERLAAFIELTLASSSLTFNDQAEHGYRHTLVCPERATLHVVSPEMESIALAYCQDRFSPELRSYLRTILKVTLTQRSIELHTYSGISAVCIHALHREMLGLLYVLRTTGSIVEKHIHKADQQ